MDSRFNQMKKRAEALIAGGIAPNILPGVTIKDLRDIACKCGGIIFSPAHTVKYASPLQTRNSTPTMVQLPMGFVCTSCGEVNNFEDPTGIIKEEEKPKTEAGGDLGVSVSESVKSKEALS